MSRAEASVADAVASLAAARAPQPALKLPPATLTAAGRAAADAAEAAVLAAYAGADPARAAQRARRPSSAPFRRDRGARRPVVRQRAVRWFLQLRELGRVLITLCVN